MTKGQVRKLIVRAIEDACVFLMMGVGVAAICIAVGGVFRLLGVG